MAARVRIKINNIFFRTTTRSSKKNENFDSPVDLRRTLRNKETKNRTLKVTETRKDRKKDRTNEQNRTEQNERKKDTKKTKERTENKQRKNNKKNERNKKQRER